MVELLPWPDEVEERDEGQFSHWEPEPVVLELPPPHPGEAVLRSKGACVGLPQLFIPAEARGAIQATYRRAAAICNSQCPVRDLCREVCDYIEKNSTDRQLCAGVWGGENPVERANRRKAAGHGGKWRGSEAA